MRLPQLPEVPARTDALPLWPPLLATRGPGGRSARHAHHAVHLALATDGALRARLSPAKPWVEASGVLTGPDVPHEIDARGAEVLLVFLDPESQAGAALSGAAAGDGLRLLSRAERDALVDGAEPSALLQAGGVEWTARAVKTLVGGALHPRRPVHPRVRKLLRLLPARPPEETSLEALAAAVDLSPGRLMHAFTASIGIPLRPYLAWIKLQRAAGAIVAGWPLAEAAHAAGFADAAHMTRTFRRMLGAAPSDLRRR